ncbi:hypothetical protein NDU88_006094 [Pleurodeles waltl]|uniref:Uncharacterized protein n=1 Tax=Pleurodeles waltl TaxID=8319 RepID=A0AAV7X060_PLEWA|nr:hypothetical protein NDU88_006094 [Pleurodeles waltl]
MALIKLRSRGGWPATNGAAHLAWCSRRLLIGSKYPVGPETSESSSAVSEDPEWKGSQQLRFPDPRRARSAGRDKRLSARSGPRRRTQQNKAVRVRCEERHKLKPDDSLRHHRPQILKEWSSEDNHTLLRVFQSATIGHRGEWGLPLGILECRDLAGVVNQPPARERKKSEQLAETQKAKQLAQTQQAKTQQEAAKRPGDHGIDPDASECQKKGLPADNTTSGIGNDVAKQESQLGGPWRMDGNIRTKKGGA